MRDARDAHAMACRIVRAIAPESASEPVLFFVCVELVMCLYEAGKEEANERQMARLAGRRHA